MSRHSDPRRRLRRGIVRAAVASATLALLAARTPAQPLDVDRDGRVDVYTDLVYIARYLLGLQPVPPSFRTPGTTPIPSDEEIRQRIEALAGTPRPTDTQTATPTRSITPTTTATATTGITQRPTDTVGLPTATLTGTSTRTAGTPSRTPTPSPTYGIEEGADVVRAAAEVSVQNPESFQIIDIGCASVGCESASGSTAFRLGVAPRSAMQTGRGGPRGVPQSCSGGGTRMETCANGEQTIVFANCVEPGAMGSTNERNGTAVFTVADPNFCDDLVVDPLKSTALELRAYRHIERNAQAAEVARLEADWLDTLLPTGLGCALASDGEQLVDGFQEVRGTMHFECRAGSMALPCPRGNTNLTLSTTGLETQRDSGGFPCELGLRITGTLSVDDRDRNLSGQSCRTQFTQTFDSYLLAEAPAGDGTSNVRQTGRMAVDRFGPLDVTTQRQQIGDATPAPTPNENASVRFVDGADCPNGGDGQIEVRRPPLIDTHASGASAAQPRGAAAAEFRQRLYRATNGQVYQVLQNVNDLSSFGSDALQITTLAASEAGSVGQCAFTAGAEARPQAVAAVERSKPFPLDRVFKSIIIPFATEPTWNRNGGQSQGGSVNDGAVCIGPGCQGNAVCPSGGQCVAFTVKGPDSTPITQDTDNAFGGIPGARLVDVPAVRSAVGCRDLGDVVTFSFGTDKPTIEIDQCSPFPAPPQGDGFRLPNGSSLVLAYDASFSSLFNAAVGGFPVDTDNNNVVCPAGVPPRVLHLGESELGSVEAPTFRFQKSQTGDPQVVFDFLGGDPQGIQTVTGCIGISPLTTCQ